jgi:hypothetical protein
MKTILQSASTGSFLKDAIRDLVVVIVGILAALWLEGWWQDRLDRKEEAFLLVGLREEFVANRQQLADHIKTWEYLFGAVVRARQLMGREVPQSEVGNVLDTFRGTLSMRFFDPRQGQLSSLINSGKLGLVSNPSLRARIADWPGLVGDLEIERAIALHSFTDGYVKTLGQYVTIFRSDEKPFDDRVNELLADRAILHELNGIGSNAERMVEEGKLIIESTDEIIRLIDDELGIAEWKL